MVSARLNGPGSLLSTSFPPSPPLDPMFRSLAGALCGETLPGNKNEEDALYASIKQHGFGLYMPDGAQYKTIGARGIPIPMLQKRASHPLKSLFMSVRRLISM